MVVSIPLPPPIGPIRTTAGDTLKSWNWPIQEKFFYFPTSTNTKDGKRWESGKHINPAKAYRKQKLDMEELHLMQLEVKIAKLSKFMGKPNVHQAIKNMMRANSGCRREKEYTRKCWNQPFKQCHRRPRWHLTEVPSTWYQINECGRKMMILWWMKRSLRGKKAC